MADLTAESEPRAGLLAEEAECHRASEHVHAAEAEGVDILLRDARQVREETDVHLLRRAERDTGTEVQVGLHHRVHRHRLMGLVLLAAIIGLTFWRWTMYAADGVVPMVYLDLAVLTVALAAFQGWLGGELVYTDGVFVRQGETTTGEGEAVSTPKGHGHHH